MSSIVIWKHFCRTEGAYVFSNSKDPICPVNGQHIIDPDLTESAPQTLFTKSNGYIQLKTVEFTALGNSTTTHVIQFDVDVSIMRIDMEIEEANRGDIIWGARSPDTPLGPITNSISAGSNIIHISPIAASQLVPGFTVSVEEGANRDDFGPIISIDKINGILTMKNNSTNNYNASTAAALLTIVSADNIKLGAPSSLSIGNGVSGSFLPSTENITIKYTNNDPSDKEIIILFLYFY